MKLEVTQLWVWYWEESALHSNPLDSGKSWKNEIYSSLPLFHAITGCDQVSLFAGKGKKMTWRTWNQYDELTTALNEILICPSKEEVEDALPTIERFVALLYDRTSVCTNVNECRKDLFARKGCLPDGIPPTLDALQLHIYWTVHQSSYCWARSLLKEATLPDPTEWGWRKADGYEIVWTKLPEASKICVRKVVVDVPWINTGCFPPSSPTARYAEHFSISYLHHVEGETEEVKRWDKCIKASLKCTALYKCRGDCES